ncbi:hypothetical protein MCEME18_00229 [Candidatus Pelagibacterales bacterium]
MINYILIFFLSIKFLFISIVPSYAYLDPGTGGILLQIIIAAIAYIGFYYRNTIKFFKNIFSKIKKKNKVK